MEENVKVVYTGVKIKNKSIKKFTMTFFVSEANYTEKLIQATMVMENKKMLPLECNLYMKNDKGDWVEI